MAYVNKIYLLEKRIQVIKNKINKYQTEKEYLKREMLLQIGIQEKKLNLPKYYTDILINDLSFEEIKEKYGINIDQKEYIIEMSKDFKKKYQELIEKENIEDKSSNNSEWSL